MNLDSIMVNAVSQIEKHKIMDGLILIWDTKQKGTNKRTRQTNTFIDTDNTIVANRGKEGWGKKKRVKYMMAERD